jgi:hypothetical protein
MEMIRPGDIALMFWAANEADNNVEGNRGKID